MGFFDDLIDNVGDSLAQTAVSYVNDTTGTDLGSAVGALFGFGQTTPGQNLQNLQAQLPGKFAGDPVGLGILQADMGRQMNLITAIGSQLTALQNSVEQLAGEIANIQNMLAQIKQQALWSDWHSVHVTAMTNYVDRVDAQYQQYSQYISQYSTTSPSEVARLMQQITNANKSYGAVAGIGGLITGTGANDKGLLQLWQEMVSPLVLNGLLDYRAAVDQYMGYYKKLTFAQLRATNLVMEAYYYNDGKTPDPNSAAQFWDSYMQQLRAQENEFIKNLFPLVQNAASPNLSFWSENNTFGWIVAAVELHPGVQATASGGDGYYAPSHIFMEAERLLANLAVKNPNMRRLVVHCTASDGAEGWKYGPVGRTVSDATITIDALGTGGGSPQATLQPSSSAQFNYVYPMGVGTAFPGAPPDQNFATGPACLVKRMVYEWTNPAGQQTYPDGMFALTDLNNSLPKLQTAVGPTSFQTPGVLAYQMQVNGLSQFDFMNFNAYMISLLYATSPIYMQS